ncbi:hypothetical protein JB92DRAFT_2997728 [Gautieria morchelliformis]|nr:hypothetical protein JB92DRAFT_2997728 [Gautieria morchelliformis]
MPPDSLFITISVLLKPVGLAMVLAFGSITRAGSTVVFCFLFLCWSVVSTTLNIGHIIRILQCGAWL